MTNDMRYTKQFNESIGEIPKLPKYLWMVSTIAFICTFGYTSLIATLLAIVYGFWSAASAIVMFVEWEIRRLKKENGESKEF